MTLSMWLIIGGFGSAIAIVLYYFCWPFDVWPKNRKKKVVRTRYNWENVPCTVRKYDNDYEGYNKPLGISPTKTAPYIPHTIPPTIPPEYKKTSPPSKSSKSSSNGYKYKSSDDDSSSSSSSSSFGFGSSSSSDSGSSSDFGGGGGDSGGGGASGDF